MIIDTNILLNSYKYKKYGGYNNYITSIIALEFLRNIDKNHNNNAKYYIPNNNYIYSIPNRIDHPWSKKSTDSIHFDFNNDFESYKLYNNESIASVINYKRFDLFKSAIFFMNKHKKKNLYKKYRYLIDNDFQCISLKEEDIYLGYKMLNIFEEKYTLKKDFRNCFNDILIIAQTINNNEKLISDDILIKKCLVEMLNGNINCENETYLYSFNRKIQNTKIIKKESKNYINRGWQYKIKSFNRIYT